MKIHGFGCLLYALVSTPVIAQEFPRFPNPIEDDTELNRNDKLDFPTIKKTVPPPLDSQPKTSLPAPNVEVVKFQIQGNTAFPETKIQSLLEDFVGKEIKDKDLEEIETAVINYYAESGFLEISAFVSSVEVLPRNSNQAIITLQVLERVVSDVQITGAGRLTPFIRKRIRKFINRPFNSQAFTNDMRFLLEKEAIDTIQAEYVPAELANEGHLTVDVRLGDIVQGIANLNNQRSPSTGEIEGSFTFIDRNLAGFGDELNIQFRKTEGANAGGASYEFPVNASDGTIAVNASFARSSVIREPIDEFDLDSETLQFGVAFRQPILQKSDDSKTQEVALGIGMRQIYTTESLSDNPFPLSAGTRIDGKFRSTILNLFQEYSRKGKRVGLLLRSDLNIGLPVGATNDPFFGDGSFVKAGLQSTLLYRLNNRFALFSRWNGQISDRTLTSSEQYSLGEQNKVRGADLNSSRDSGISFSQEIRTLLFQSKQHQLEIAPFFDIGYAGNQTQQFFQDNLTLASLGIALRYQFANQLFASIEYAQPILGRESFQDSSNFKFTVTGKIF